MQGRAKGLKVQVERTANQLSNQDTSAFIPPTEGTDSDQVTAAAAADQVGESGGGADIDNGTRGSDGAEGGIADTGDSPPLTLNPNELQEATNEELMSMLRHQSARLQKLEEEYSRLKSKATLRDGGQVAQRDLERSQEECQLAKDNARELGERYTALQEKFRAMEGSAGDGYRGADYNKVVERMKGLIGKFKETQGTIRSLQSQVEELGAHRVATSPEGDDDGGEGDSGPGRDEGAANPDFGATIAALQDQLREVTRAKDDAEKRAEMAAAASTVPGERVEEGREYETVAELKTQLEKKQAENESIASRLNELAQRYRALQQEDEARKAEYNSAAAERVAVMERQLAASDEKTVDLARRCEVAEAGHERIEGSLKIALSRVVDLDSSATSATASVAAIEKELRAAREELREAKDERDETSAKLEAKSAEFQNILGKAKDLADRYRTLQALAEGSASELADALQREEQHLAEASAMREELARAAEQCTAATAAVVAVREKEKARIDELAEQLAAVRWGASEKVGALEEKLRRATEEEHGALEGKLAEAKAEAENVRTHGEEKTRGMLEEQARRAEHAMTVAIKDAVDKARADEAARFLVEVKQLSSEHTEVLARASATAEREVSRVRLEAEEARAALAFELVSAGEQLAAATARAEEFAGDLCVARAREVYVTRRVEEREAAEEEQRAVVEAEMESVRRELDRACGAEQDAAGEIERLAAQLESAQDGASSEAATLREQMAAAEGARQAAVLRATSLEEEVSGLRASAAEAAVAAKTVEVEAREEAARLSRELDVATEAAAAEEQRTKVLAAELANVKSAAVTTEESTKAAVAEAVERAEAEREKAVGNVKTVRILEEQTMMARRTAEEAQSRLEAMGTEAEALREKAQTSEGRVAKLQALVTELETKLVKLEASEQSAKERYDVVSSKLKELISRYKELRDSALASESNAESAEAAAFEAERQASAFREERDAAWEEVGAMRGVVRSLSEELEQVRQARNRLDGRRAELQMALGAEKLRRAFGVPGGSGATAAAAADVFEGVFKRWRLACLEGRQGRLKRESEENRGKAESFQGLVQRLSEELERQGQAANHHAKVIRQRESELEAALDRANRAHDELIAMEPPSLSQAIGGVEILLRVSTQPAPSMAVAAGTEEKSGPVEEDAGTGARGRQSENGQEDVWCLVRYEKAPSSSKKRGGISKETDVWTLSVEEGKGESGLEAGENALDDHGDEEGDEGAGQAPARAAVEAKVEAAKMTEEWEKHEVEGEAEQAPLTVFPSACGGDDDNAGGDAVAAAPRTAEGEDSEGQPSPPSSLPSSASVAGQDTVVVIEWRTQGEVDEWFATRLETAVEEEYYQQERSRLERAEGDAGEETAAATAEASMVAPRAAVPVLETPLTIQESFAAEMARVEAELNSKLEMARAELSRNTEAHKQYRARAHTAIKTSGASQREAEERITQAHRELATERELVRKALEDRAAAEARWADESATLKQHIDEVEARVASAAVRTAELEAGMARFVEEGVKAARDETVEVRRRFKEQEAATAEAREALATANAELEKARRELKQRSQFARNLLAEKDAEISRLRSGGRGVGAGVNVGGLGGGIYPNVNGDALGFQQGKVSPSAVDGVSSSSPDPASDSVVGAPSLGAAAMGTATDGTSPASLPDDREGRKRFQGGGDEKGPANQQQKPADSHHAEQQILQTARVQSHRDDEMGRLRVKLQRQSEEIRAREERLAARDEEKERLRSHIEELEAEATRSKDLLDQEHGREKMTYLKNVVKKFVVSERNERHRLVPVLATILSFSPAELSEVDRAVASAARSGGSSWTSMFGSA